MKRERRLTGIRHRAEIRQLVSVVDDRRAGLACRRSRRARSVAEDREIEAPYAFGIGDRVDRGDLSVRDREGEHHHQPSARRDDDAHVAVDERGPRRARAAGDSAPRDDRGAAHFGGRARREGRAIHAEHDVGIEEREPRFMRQAGETDERLFAVAAWRDAPYFTDAERAALALTEAVTRLSDRTDPVPDEVWNEAARHYDERGMAALVVAIATINAWNRPNAATRQVAGEWIRAAQQAAH